MNGFGNSDGFIVPEKPANKTSTLKGQVELFAKEADNGELRPTKLSAERVEGREPAKGNPRGQNRDRTQRRGALQSATGRIRQYVRREKKERLTNLWHNVYSEERLFEAYHAQKHGASAGADGVTWETYGKDLEKNLRDLSNRLRKGTYRAKPVQRVYIPKADGRKRPIGIPVLEDKIVQRATVEVMGAVYEEEFLGFSYGFRPGRSQHNALDALWVGIVSRKVNWVLDMDIRGFFDAIDHGWLMKMVEYRIGDKRVTRQIRKWLKAGVLEEGKVRESTSGTPQGGSISPLLANIYLHYSFDQWAHEWRKRKSYGDVIVVRYADDIVMGFEHKGDAEAFLEEVTVRLQKFKLELHPEKTRLLEFGRYASERRYRHKDGRPETFDFLGFRHICGLSQEGKYVVRRRTISHRMRSKLREVKEQLRYRMHQNVNEQGKWLSRILRGYFQYHGIPGNIMVLKAFRWEIARYWKHVLNRRSQKARIGLERMRKLIQDWLPEPVVVHQSPFERLRV